MKKQEERERKRAAKKVHKLFGKASKKKTNPKNVIERARDPRFNGKIGAPVLPQPESDVDEVLTETESDVDEEMSQDEAEKITQKANIGTDSDRDMLTQSVENLKKFSKAFSSGDDSSSEEERIRARKQKMMIKSGILSLDHHSYNTGNKSTE